MVTNTPKNDYYVYVYRDERGIPRYVGKGRGTRDHQHLAAAHRNLAANRRGKTPWLRYLQAALRRGQSFTITRSPETLTHEQANTLETKLIAQYGRRLFKRSGTLLNFTTGGEGMDSESATIANRRKAANPEYRTTLRTAMQRVAADPKYRQQQRAALKRVAADPDWQTKHRATNQRRAANPEWRAKNRAAMQRNAANPEWREKQRTGAKRRSANPEWRAKNRAAMRSIARQRKYKTTNDPRQLALPL